MMRAAMLAGAALVLTACGDGGRTEQATTVSTPAPAATSPAASAPTAGTVSSSGMPSQRPGLWRVTVNLPVVGAQSVEQCITPAEAARGMDINASDMGECGTPDVTRDGEGWTVNTVCGRGPTRSEIRSRIEGDPQSRYTVRTNVAAASGDPMEIRAEATYVGPCPA